MSQHETKALLTDAADALAFVIKRTAGLSRERDSAPFGLRSLRLSIDVSEVNLIQRRSN